MHTHTHAHTHTCFAQTHACAGYRAPSAIELVLRPGCAAVWEGFRNIGDSEKEKKLLQVGRVAVRWRCFPAQTSVLHRGLCWEAGQGWGRGRRGAPSLQTIKRPAITPGRSAAWRRRGARIQKCASVAQHPSFAGPPWEASQHTSRAAAASPHAALGAAQPGGGGSRTAGNQAAAHCSCWGPRRRRRRQQQQGSGGGSGRAAQLGWCEPQSARGAAEGQPAHGAGAGDAGGWQGVQHVCGYV